MPPSLFPILSVLLVSTSATPAPVVTWGWWQYGGDSSSVSSSLTSGVSAIYSTDNTFAALKTDGSVVTWGSGSFGGDSSSVSSFLASGVSAIYSTDGAFATLPASPAAQASGDPHLKLGVTEARRTSAAPTRASTTSSRPRTSRST